MATLRPDPTFYPSPGMAMQAPAERLAYVTMLNADKNGKHDAMGVVDLDPASTTYGQLVGQTDFPTATTSCTTLAGMRAARVSARRRRIRTWSAAT